MTKIVTAALALTALLASGATLAQKDTKSPNTPLPSAPIILAPIVVQAAQPAVGRFRVTLLGWRVDRQTWDHVFESDGGGDEVFVMSEARVVDATNRTLFGPSGVRSVVVGDTNNYPNRLRGGSAHAPFGGNGGFTSGDRFPTATPWIRGGPPQPDRFPMLLFQGDLADGQAAMIVPTLWEWDGEPSFLTTLGRILFAPLLPLSDVAGLVVNAPSPTDVPAAIARTVVRTASSLGLRQGAPGVNVTVGKSLLGDAKDRPIGMQDAGLNYAFDPQVLVFNRATAERLARTDFGFGPGVLAVRYQDAEALKGDYTLFVQVEQVR
ncbi:hypothetical protein [Deinococcus yavapaiensis]|uniref:Uncharacterized protein n=1 Tax=Deinococcus yavapaiensis KR-236 TaxID=694435 RepID=A0A318SE34_9DEIO|nr:hypothetical protein [Deinococcus yavapaiensis]PYE55798.1 hypothetical protein DES52_102163 [Deinococcus yavapaiensis KR-236]